MQYRNVGSSRLRYNIFDQTIEKLSTIFDREFRVSSKLIFLLDKAYCG